MLFWLVQIFDASADIMEKAFEEGAKIRREAEARKAAIAARSRGGGAVRTAPGGGRSSRSAGVKRASSGAAKLPWTLTAMPVPVTLPPAGVAAAAAARPAAAVAASPATAVESELPHDGVNGDVPPTAAPAAPAPAAAAAAAAPADSTALTGDAPPAKRHKSGKRGRKASEPQPPRVPLQQSGLGMLPTLLPKAAGRTEAAPHRPPARQVHVGPLLAVVHASAVEVVLIVFAGFAGGFADASCIPCASRRCWHWQHGASCTVCIACRAGSTGKVTTQSTTLQQLFTVLLRESSSVHAAIVIKRRMPSLQGLQPRPAQQAQQPLGSAAQLPTSKPVKMQVPRPGSAGPPGQWF